TGVAPGQGTANCSVQGALVQCAAGDLAVGQTVTVLVTVEVDHNLSGPLVGTNNASFESTATPQPPRRPRFNCHCSFDRGTDHRCTRAIGIDDRPAIRLTKTVVAPPQPAPLVTGTDATYELKAFNDGPWSARLGLADTLPSGVTYLSAAGDGWDC